MERNYKLDNIRAAAILAVVIGHSIILYSSSWNLYEPSIRCPFLDYLKHFINIFQMPLFFSLSGYLFSANGCRQDFPSFFFKKFKRLIIPFLFIGIFLMIPLKMYLGYPGYAGSGYLPAIKNLILGNESGHLWYLPTLFLILLASYWIFKGAEHFPSTLIIAFLLSIILSLVCYRLPNLRIPYQYSVFAHLWGFLLGSMIHRYKIDQVLQKQKLLILLAAVIVSAIDIFYIQTSIIAPVLFIISIYLWMPNVRNRLFQILSRNSFGIYLLHSPFIYITFTYFLNASPFVTVTINFVIWGLVSLFLTNMIRKTRIRFIIGE